MKVLLCLQIIKVVLGGECAIFQRILKTNLYLWVAYTEEHTRHLKSKQLGLIFTSNVPILSRNKYKAQGCALIHVVSRKSFSRSSLNAYTFTFASLRVACQCDTGMQH